MKRTFGAHWLAFLGGVQAGEGERLARAVKTSVGAGCTMFELACNPVNQMTAVETAEAVQKGGMTKVSYCRFFPGGEPPPCGDPIGDDAGISLAKATLEADLTFIEELRQQGLAVEFMTGPSCFVLGMRYDLDLRTRRKRLRRYAMHQGQMAASANITVALEYLRPGEDQEVIGGMREMCRLIDAVDHPNIRVHADVYHMTMRRELPWRALLHAGKRVAYLHAQGTDRVAPGVYKLDSLPEATDRVNWYLIGKALDEIGYTGPVVSEPFGEQIRKEVPALGEGLPPAIDERRFYDLAGDHLRLCGVL